MSKHVKIRQKKQSIASESHTLKYIFIIKWIKKKINRFHDLYITDKKGIWGGWGMIFFLFKTFFLSQEKW